jgi:hypothetical protein
VSAPALPARASIAALAFFRHFPHFRHCRLHARCPRVSRLCFCAIFVRTKLAEKVAEYTVKNNGRVRLRL